MFPGAYYIRINSYKDTFNAQLYYKLLLDVNYQFENVSISELKYSKGVGAALWVSDYDPFSIEPFTIQSKSEVGYYTSTDTYSAFCFGNPIFEYVRNGEYINHASLYIWDFNLRKSLYNIVTETIEKLEPEFTSNEKLRIGYDIKSEIVNGISTITSIILMITPVNNASKVVKFTLNLISAVTTIGPPVLDCIFDVFMPQSMVEKKSKYLNYLSVLSAALECNDSTSSNEVIKIDSDYIVNAEKVFGIIQMNYDIDFTPKVQKNYLYGDDTIYAFNDKSRFNGTVYPLKSLSDIENARKKNRINFDDVNTGGNKKLLLNQPVADEIFEGEYRWYNFTAPENGIYTFRTNSEIDTYGELFNSIVPGYSSSGRITYNDDYEDNKNFAITYKLFEGRTIYLRVRGYNWKANGLYSIYVNKVDNIDIVAEEIKDSDFNFSNEYVDNLNRSSVSLESGFTFTTQRVRCGYINNQYLALSAKCKDAGIAYLQMDFTQDIQSIDFDIAIWSDEEYLNENSSIILETKDTNGGYNMEYCFNIDELSKNKDSLDHFNFIFNKPTYGIKVTVTTNKVNYEKNKGRVVLSNFIIRH